jgi:hypothetical protein
MAEEQEGPNSNFLELTSKNYHFNVSDEGEIEMSKHEML